MIVASKVTNKVIVRAVTAAGSSASYVGMRHDGPGIYWRNAVDACDFDGEGRVFFDCDDEGVVDALAAALADDDEVMLVEVL